MTILLTGTTGYIGKRLLPLLIADGHDVICLVRDAHRLNVAPEIRNKINVVEGDLLDRESLNNLPQQIDSAYYLVHSMSSSDDYAELEAKAAENFIDALSTRNTKQVIYLGGISNEEQLSKHLASRQNVGKILSKGTFALTWFCAGIIIGSGSASFEIIRDLVEKLPLMITPKWLKTKCQPIAIADVLQILRSSLGNKKCYDQKFDIGGPDVLTYKEMLLQFALVRGLKRWIITVPVMTPRLSSYWLYFVTSTTYKLASSLVDSMKVEVICRERRINDVLDITPMNYRSALTRAFAKIERHEIVSSWKDSYISSNSKYNINDYIEVPSYGCFVDRRKMKIQDRQRTLNKIWSIGGSSGWYYGQWLWQLRGILDKMVGGVGLRRGRTHPSEIHSGDTLDFWRVLYANKEEGRLLLFAEMKLPGEAWLEFKIKGDKLVQTATFRSLGLSGRLYWYAVLPFHGFIFKGMLRKIVDYR